MNKILENNWIPIICFIVSLIIMNCVNIDSPLWLKIIFSVIALINMIITITYAILLVKKNKQIQKTEDEDDTN